MYTAGPTSMTWPVATECAVNKGMNRVRSDISDVERLGTQFSHHQVTLCARPDFSDVAGANRMRSGFCRGV
jgi:hypothetical protein